MILIDFVFEIFIGVYLIYNVVIFRYIAKWIRYTYMYIHFFKNFSPVLRRKYIFYYISQYRVLSRVPSIYSRFLLVISFIHSKVYMSIPVSQWSLHSLSPGNHRFIFYICDSASVLQISSFVPFFGFHIQVIWYLSFCV